jgi:hypothetical protein
VGLRSVEKSTGKVRDESKDTRTGGEPVREAKRQRELRDVQAAINKGHRNQAIDQFFRS